MYIVYLFIKTAVGVSKILQYKVTYHQLVGDLGNDHAKGEQIQTGVVLEQLAGRLLENDESQGEDEANVHTRTQHTGVLHRGKGLVSTQDVQVQLRLLNDPQLTYSYCGAIFANASVHDDMEVVVAGVEGSTDDTKDGEGVHWQSDDRQL